MKKRRIDLKALRYVGKAVLKKQTLKKIASVGDLEEQQRLYEYAIRAALEFEYASLMEDIHEREKNKKDVFIPLMKGHLLGSKIHFFNATFQKKDYLSIKKLFNEIRKELT